jgi:hypothetical protein
MDGCLYCEVEGRTPWKCFCQSRNSDPISENIFDFRYSVVT